MATTRQKRRAAKEKRRRARKAKQVQPAKVSLRSRLRDAMAQLERHLELDPKRRCTSVDDLAPYLDELNEESPQAPVLLIEHLARDGLVYVERDRLVLATLVVDDEKIDAHHQVLRRPLTLSAEGEGEGAQANG